MYSTVIFFADFFMLKMKTISASPFAKMQQWKYHVILLHSHRCDSDLEHRHNYNYQPFFNDILITLLLLLYYILL